MPPDEDIVFAGMRLVTFSHALCIPIHLALIIETPASLFFSLTSRQPLLFTQYAMHIERIINSLHFKCSLRVCEFSIYSSSLFSRRRRLILDQLGLRATRSKKSEERERVARKRNQPFIHLLFNKSWKWSTAVVNEPRSVRKGTVRHLVSRVSATANERRQAVRRASEKIMDKGQCDSSDRLATVASARETEKGWNQIIDSSENERQLSLSELRTYVHIPFSDGRKKTDNMFPRRLIL